MTTPLPLPVRPSCRLTWIEYRPFFMTWWPVATSGIAESVKPLCQSAARGVNATGLPGTCTRRGLHTTLPDTRMTTEYVGRKVGPRNAWQWLQEHFRLSGNRLAARNALD